ncbi:hypothetical protein [Bacillus inaquosorum]|uniref:hypothetical protein n=1 Tax=Bacillus subtilis group TaxID=653685 RepID=UPI0034615BFD
MTPNDFITKVQSDLKRAWECEHECLKRRYNDDPPIGQVNDIDKKYNELQELIFNKAFS